MRLKSPPRLALVASVLLVLIVLERMYFHAPETVMEWLRNLEPGQAALPLLLGVAAYMLLLSLPFLPGMELGILLMAFFGKEGTVLVYLGTVGGLNLAYLLGRWLPVRWTPARISRLAAHEEEEEGGLVEHLLNKTRWGRRLGSGQRSTLATSPYLLLALLLNLPGNFLLGGGGGISMVFGITRLLSWRSFFLTVCLATAPVPLLVLLGILQIESLLG